MILRSRPPGSKTLHPHPFCNRYRTRYCNRDRTCYCDRNFTPCCIRSARLLKPGRNPANAGQVDCGLPGLAPVGVEPRLMPVRMYCVLEE